MTTTTELCRVGEGIIKTDSLGRMKVGKAQREQLLDAFEDSGMSATAFAQYSGVKYQTFATWVQKRKKQRGQYPERASSPPAKLLQSLAEVVPASASENGLSIDLPGGARVTITDPCQAALAAALLKHLTSPQPC